MKFWCKLVPHCTSVCLSFCPSVYPSVCPSVCLSICVSVILFCLFVCLSPSLDKTLSTHVLIDGCMNFSENLYIDYSASEDVHLVFSYWLGNNISSVYRFFFYSFYLLSLFISCGLILIVLIREKGWSLWNEYQNFIKETSLKPFDICILNEM